jgi:hypothetical protein
MFDIIFLSYNEPNADANWVKLKERFPIARRVHGVKGIHQAHIAAAHRTMTKMFWVVDGDSTVMDSFAFVDPKELWKPEESVYVYQSKNPVNGLTYGYGGIKLLPRDKTINMDTNTVDMTTSIGYYFTAIEQIASTTNFNTDPFNTWKSAFRECAKLSSQVIRNQISKETEERLHIWCTAGEDKPYGKYAIAGAIQGTAWAKETDDLKLINDFEWLKETYANSF